MSQIDLQALKTEIKELIINTLKVKNVTPEDIDDSAPLLARDNPMGLDSVDAIDIIMTVQKHFGVRIADQNLARTVLDSIDSLAVFIANEKANRPNEAVSKPA